ncbi:MAG: tetratricopeptide repeat protein [Akkermansiaceae bacterium]|nr:tetratricopeptide repeat protein [Armatimonadota bacterium]
MTCKECNQRNPIGNKFCRECGAKIVIPEGSLAAEEAARADSERKAERGAVLLSEAHLLAEQGKYVAAVPVAEEAVSTLPFSVSSLTLLVTLYEHTGQQEKAVATQERIVELVPNAVSETTRLERLRRGERTSAAPDSPVSAGWVPTLRGATPTTVPFLLPQWFPVAAGIVGGGFALFLGFLAMAPGKTKPSNVTVQQSPVAIVSPAPSVTLPMNPGATLPPVQDPNRGGDPFVSLDETRRRLQQQNTPLSTGRPSPANITAGAALPLPKPLPGTRSTVPKPGPVVIPADIIKVTKGNPNEEGALPPIVAAPPTNDARGSGFGNGERVAAVAPPQEAAPSRPSSGYMKITVNQRPGPTPIPVAPPQSASAPDMESDPMQRARVLQGLGRYKDAISSYQEAISAGASAGEAQQGIGMCYQRAGDASNARVAYIQAIAAYKAQIAAGRNPSAAQRGLYTCEAALGVISGG